MSDWIRKVDYRDPQTNEHHRILISAPSYYPNSPEETFCLVEKPISYLQNRGWVMQEEILSRRKICFSASELHWQCKTISQCECGLKSLADPQFADDFTRNTLVRRGDDRFTRALSASDSIRTRETRDLNKTWKNLVDIYAQREFTSSSCGSCIKAWPPSAKLLGGSLA